MTSLLAHERIVTTVAKAKEAARQAEKIITLGKRGTPTALSSAQSYLFATGESMPRLAAMAQRYAERPGGYTRIHLMGHRKGDHAPRAILELVDNPTDVKLDMTARAMARETDIMLRRAQRNVSLAELHTLLAAQPNVPLERDERFAPLTRRNISKLVRYRGETARTELAQKAAQYLEQQWGAVELLRFTGIVVVVSNAIAVVLAVLLFVVLRTDRPLYVARAAHPQLRHALSRPRGAPDGLPRGAGAAHPAPRDPAAWLALPHARP